MNLLAIETSCDETAISILSCKDDTVSVLAHEINSQIEIHKEYGGVYPNLAKREHVHNLVPVLLAALTKAELPHTSLTLDESAKNKLSEILNREPDLYPLLISFLETYGKATFDAIAVTEGPGLEPALWVGINFAKALSFIWNIPIISVNHMEGHIISALLKHTSEKEIHIQDIAYPAIALLVSGGHTEIIKIEKLGSYEVVGRTRDDAVGEAFDKTARLLGFPYPGGPEISKLAAKGEELKLSTAEFVLPRPMLHSKDLDFSFSGIKTSVRYKIEKISELTDTIKMSIAKEFEDAVVEVLVEKTAQAVDAYNARTVLVGGGVIANTKLRKALTSKLSGTDIHIPDLKYTTDNATMIGISGYLTTQRLEKPYAETLRAQGALSLDKNF